MALSVHDVFARLAGRWKLDRLIPDQGVFRGEVVFTQETFDRLRCDESGILSLTKGGEMSASRSYIYELAADHLTILYNDPYRKDEILHELFFTESEGVLSSRHCHVCDDDRYDLTFVFANEGRIEMKYDIQGPAKNYRMESVLTPL